MISSTSSTHVRDLSRPAVNTSKSQPYIKNNPDNHVIIKIIKELYGSDFIVLLNSLMPDVH